MSCTGANGRVQLGAGFQAAFGPQAQGADGKYILMDC